MSSKPRLALTKNEGENKPVRANKFELNIGFNKLILIQEPLETEFLDKLAKTAAYGILNSNQEKSNYSQTQISTNFKQNEFFNNTMNQTNLVEELRAKSKIIGSATLLSLSVPNLNHYAGNIATATETNIIYCSSNINRSHNSKNDKKHNNLMPNQSHECSSEYIPSKEFSESLNSNFPSYSSAELKIGVDTTKQDLAQIKSSINGKSVLDRLESSVLTELQKKRVLEALASVRENYTKQRVNGFIDSDQKVNWIHTQGELGRVIDIADAAHLSKDELEDALLASMFSDSIKSKSNFFVHHLEGAEAAKKVLSYLDKTKLNSIIQCIKEHQVGPPDFMAMLYTDRIKASLLQENHEISPKDASILKRIHEKIANPMSQEWKHHQLQDGATTISFSPEELALLKYTRVDAWYIPNESHPWNKSSRALIDADSLDNYVTPGGISKLVHIRGPESDQWFRDRRLDDRNAFTGSKTIHPYRSVLSIDSARLSRIQAEKMMTPAALSLASVAGTKLEETIAEAKIIVEDWLKEEHNINTHKTEIPFWNKDLKYPQRSPMHEARWWQIHRKPENMRSSEEMDFYLKHRYDGLNKEEIEFFKLAIEIREKFVEILRRAQFIENKAPNDYLPVMNTKTN